MRKLMALFAVACLVLCCAPLFAQGANPVKAGNMSVGLFDLFSYSGFASGDIYTDGSDKLSAVGVNISSIHPSLTMFAIRPEVTYFVTDGLALGGTLTYAQFKASGNKLTVWGVGPVVYYYFKATEALYPYVTAGFSYGSLKEDGSSDKMTVQRIPLGAGVLMMIGNNVGIYGQIIYNMDKFEEGSSQEDGKIFDIRVGFKGYF